MRFYVKQKRRPQIIIISLIDVLCVLLIFFMVSAKFQTVAAIKLTLPQSRTAQEVKVENKIVLMITGDGEIYVNEKLVDSENLSDELIEIKRRTPDVALELNADEKAPFGMVVQVMDSAKIAGLKTVNAFARKMVNPE